MSGGERNDRRESARDGDAVSGRKAGVGFTATQRQRLRELGVSPAAGERRFSTTAERDATFKALERDAASQARRYLAELREGARRPQLRVLEDDLSRALREAGAVEVATPHLLSRDAIDRMGIPDDDPLREQIFWVTSRQCLRPMLAPNLYTMMRRLTRTWRQPFAIFEVGTCFRRDTQGSRHLQEFTMLNVVELGTVLEQRRSRLEELASIVLDASGITEWELRHEASGVYGDTLAVLARGIEVCSTAMGPHPLDDAWGITDPWVGLGFGLERLLTAREGHANIERVARSLSYLDGIRLHL